MTEDSGHQPIPFWRFASVLAIAGILALSIFLLSMFSSAVAGGLICLGALAKVVSETIGAAAKAKELEASKSWIEERLGYLDALAALTAFPALFAVGAEMFFNSLP